LETALVEVAAGARVAGFGHRGTVAQGKRKRKRPPDEGGRLIGEGRERRERQSPTPLGKGT